MALTERLISIRERSGEGDGGNAVLSFDGQGEYPMTIMPPFSEQEEKRLEWYFEDHLRFPFVEQVKAREAAASVAAYGQRLFEQVFADRRAYAEYMRMLQVGVGSLAFEVVGSPEFHQLHWEALWD